MGEDDMLVLVYRVGAESPSLKYYAKCEGHG
jgi:hypothetical protein